MANKGMDMSGMKVEILSKQDADPYLEKFGIPEDFVCHMYETIKKADEIKGDEDKMAAVQQYAADEKDDADNVINSLDDQQKALNKLQGTQGKKAYDESSNTYDQNADNYVGPEGE